MTVLDAARFIWEHLQRRRGVFLAVAALVVFVTTYLLILPAITLDKDKAAEQGGIDVPVAEQVLEDSGPGDKGDPADVDAAKAGQGETDPSEDSAPAEIADEEDANTTDSGDAPLSFTGEGYQITASAEEDAELPEGTELVAQEITSEDKDYQGWCDEAMKALEENEKDEPAFSLKSAKFYDISLLAADKVIEPSAPVQVKISYDKAMKVSDADHVRIIHFAVDEDGNLKPEVLDEKDVELSLEKTKKDESPKVSEVTFDAPSFSVYAIVDAPEESYEPAGEHVTQSLDQIADLGDEGLYLSNLKYYLTGDVVHNVTGNSDRDGLVATSSQYNEVPLEEAVKFYFEPVPNTEDQFYIYTLEEGQPKYLKMTKVNGNNARGGLTIVSDPNERTPFKLEKNNKNNTFRVSAVVGNTTYYWNRNANNPGAGAIVGYNNGGDKNVAWIELHYKTEPVNDPYGLDGKSYGIAYQNGANTGAAMTDQGRTVNNQQRLVSTALKFKPDVISNQGNLLIAEGTDLTEWTFECVSEDKYYIKTKVGEATKYVTLQGANLTLEDEPDQTASVFRAIPGTGDNKGKWHFTSNSSSLALAGGTGNGFNGNSGNGAMTWLNLVEKSVLEEDDFHTYRAEKVSVSDTEKVYNGQQVVIYTRLWNETAKKYDYFVVDHDGSFKPCNSSGDNIVWLGSDINTALWEFTEYTEKDGTPNYYYDLRNVQYGNYIAPQMTDGQIVSDSPMGINLDGRRNGKNYTTIIAWDDDHYEYAGLKSEDGKIVSCPLDEAHDYYFAVMDLKEPQTPEGELTTVETINNNQYGITMKMIDYDNAIVNERDSLQTSVLGLNTNKPGLLSTDLKENGYPNTTSETGVAESSLSALYTGTTPANHLFIESVYNESGYFEYDSTQNFAHLNENGNFTVYDQLGSIGTASGPTRTHGQFMPYNDLQEGLFSTVTNQTTVTQQKLPDSDPRKGEEMYLIPQDRADYFFGMEMQAGFTQTADGLDDWGHDIIFEFSGDDDFWFYVDGELVLDLGGVHSAMTGSINFRTGEVKSSRGDSTLYQIFKSNFEGREMTEAEVNAKLEEIFKVNDNGDYVFKDYTNHTMKMFYMERGSGASNLKMRFNLASVKQGTALLGKKLSGTESASNKLVAYPYQIWYKTADVQTDPQTGEVIRDEQGNPVTEISQAKQLIIDPENPNCKVVYKDTNRNVPFKTSYPAGEQEYEKVFLLKPGEEAEIDFPENTVWYKVVECGVDTDIYDEVKINGVPAYGRPYNNQDGSPEPAPGSQTETITYNNSTRSDFGTDYMELSKQSKVEFDNHVTEEAVRTMSITKRLYDSDGETRLSYPENPSLFSFRLYLGDENDDTNQLPLADMYEYHVKDASGNYCRYNADEKKFISLGKTVYSELTAAEKKSATFTTSMNGSISKIPADYTVEIRDLIVGVQYKIEERDSEIPKGYTLRLEDGYQRIDSGHEENTQTTPYNGTIVKNQDPEIAVSNQKGWGLTVNKVWTDRDFMEERDPINFAVYRNQGTDTEEDLVLVPDTVRQLSSDETSLYYFFGQLQAGTPFNKYVVREVNVAAPSGQELVIDDEGYVTGYKTVTPIAQGDSLHIDGKPYGGEYSQDNAYEYKVRYDQGNQTTQNENVRTDTVTNSRPGIELYKTDWAGQPLRGAAFSLKDASGNNVALPTYTSDENGLITTAYLLPGTYTLEETQTPKGYLGLGDPMTIIVKADGTIDQVSGVDSSIYSISSGDADMNGRITIKNRSSDLKVIKIDDSDDTLLEGVHFALYHQVTDNEGNKRKDLYPIQGYEDLATDAEGILPGVDMNLAAGTYYLTETSTLTGYGLLPEDLCFTIAKDGSVSIDTAKYANWLTSTTDSNGKVSYTLTIRNGKQKNVTVEKVSAGTTDVLQGASFKLYLAKDYNDGTSTPVQGAQPITEGTTGTDGILNLGMLSIGNYRLVETGAPAGYNLLDSAVKIEIREDGVTAIQAGNSQEAEYIQSADTYQISVWNTAGVELPSSGGPGTTWIYLLGAVLLLGCSITLIARRRSRVE